MTIEATERHLAAALALLAEIHDEVRDLPERQPFSSDSYLPPHLVERLAATVAALTTHLDPEATDA